LLDFCLYVNVDRGLLHGDLGIIDDTGGIIKIISRKNRRIGLCSEDLCQQSRKCFSVLKKQTAKIQKNKIKYSKAQKKEGEKKERKREDVILTGYFAISDLRVCGTSMSISRFSSLGCFVIGSLTRQEEASGTLRASCSKEEKNDEKNN
jgi:hypothetical protein